MDLENYNKSYEQVVEILAEEIENKLRLMRQQCVKELIDRLNSREQEWDSTFRELLVKSQEEDILANKEESLKSQTKPLTFNILTTPLVNSSNSKGFDKNQIISNNNDPSISINYTKENIEPKNDTSAKLSSTIDASTKSKPPLQSKQNEQIKEPQINDPSFNNSIPIKEFIRVQEMLERDRQSFVQLNTDPSLKPFKNEINLFIRTQINSISNSDSQHLDTKIRLLTNLFIGQGVSYQNKFVDARKHPQGQLFAMNLAAQTFVTVGIRLVNSVPAIAKSMASVINGIINNNLSIFKDYVIGNLQEQCPYLIPMHLNIDDFSKEVNQEVKYKIACGYSYDSKGQALESDEKYLIRMRSMTLIYACTIIQQNIDLAWSWLTSFLSLKPQPVISATILQAFLQEASKKLSNTYGRQYKKLLNFIKDDYVKMIESITPKTSDRQSLIKLKNLLSDNSILFEAPTVNSIFGSFINS